MTNDGQIGILCGGVGAYLALYAFGKIDIQMTLWASIGCVIGTVFIFGIRKLFCQK